MRFTKRFSSLFFSSYRHVCIAYGIILTYNVILYITHKCYRHDFIKVFWNDIKLDGLNCLILDFGFSVSCSNLRSTHSVISMGAQINVCVAYKDNFSNTHFVILWTVNVSATLTSLYLGLYWNKITSVPRIRLQLLFLTDCVPIRIRQDAHGNFIDIARLKYSWFNSWYDFKSSK